MKTEACGWWKISAHMTIKRKYSVNEITVQLLGLLSVRVLKGVCIYVKGINEGRWSSPANSTGIPASCPLQSLLWLLYNIAFINITSCPVCQNYPGFLSESSMFQEALQSSVNQDHWSLPPSPSWKYYSLLWTLALWTLTINLPLLLSWNSKYLEVPTTARKWPSFLLSWKVPAGNLRVSKFWRDLTRERINVSIVFVMLVVWSCLTPGNPMDYNPPGSSVHGILQARILDGLSFPSPSVLFTRI